MAVKNEMGNRYERILVGERAPNNDRGEAQWHCHCDCGTDFITKGISLRSGHTKSCGCLQKDRVRAQGLKNTIDLIGKHFGMLEVVERVIGDKDNRGKWRCICDCGGETITTADHLNDGHTISCGCVKSQREFRIGQILTSLNLTFSKEFTFSDLKSDKGYSLRFDFALFKNETLQCLIEHDGKQHYDSNSTWWTPELEYNDIIKDNYCLKKSIALYRIRYDDDLETILENILKKEDFINGT